MALSERLQVLLEAVGGASVVSEFAQVGRSAQTEFSKVSAEADKAEAQVAKLEARLSKATPGTNNYDKLTNQLSAARTEAAKFQDSAGPLDGLLQKLGISGAGMGTAVAAGAATASAAVGVGLVSAVKKGIDSYVELGGQTLEVQRLTGGSAQQVSTFASVLRQLGVNVDDSSRSLGIFEANIATHPARFQAAGVAIAHYKDGTVDTIGTLNNLGQALQNSADKTQADALAKQVLGRGYQTLLPYLTQSTSALQQFQAEAAKHGEVLNQDDVEKAHAYSIAMNELQGAVASVERDMASGLVPELTEIAHNIDTLITKTQELAHSLPSIPGGWGKTLEGFIPGAGQLIQLLSSGSSAAKDNAAAMDQAAASTSDLSSVNTDAASSENALVSAAKGLDSAERSVASANREAANAAHSLQQAQEGVTTAHENTIKAQERLGQAQQNLNDLLAKGAVDAKAVESAERQLQSATQGVAHAQQSLADAQTALNTALAGASPDELTDAQLRYQRSILSTQQAQDALNQAQAPHAGRSVLQEEEAQQSLAEAEQAQKEALENLNAVKAKGTAQDPAVISAQRQVQTATESLTTAIQNQQDAADNLRTAQAGDPQFDQKIATARLQIRDASDAVTTAQRGERDAAYQVSQAQQSVADAKDNQTRASNDLTTAQYGLNDAFSDFDGLANDVNGQIANLIAQYPQLAGILNSLTPSSSGYGIWDTSAGGAMPASQRPGFAEGGLVPGGLGQPLLAVVHGGEFVLTPEMQRGLVAGNDMPPVSGGTSGGPVVINVNMPNYIGNRDDVLAMFRAALTKTALRNAGLRLN